MDATKLLYLDVMDILENEAKVLDVYQENGKDVVVLDQTIFYPQGGGQPYDTGKITSGASEFSVEEVRYVEGVVKHIGKFTKSTFNKSDEITCLVEPERRKLNSRIHSGGHLVDMSVYEAKPSWIPGKGYHFPDGPYVEYTGELLEEEKENLIKRLEDAGNSFIKRQIPVKVLFCKKNELSQFCRHVPDNIPEGKPTRLVLFGDFGVPCGGTHVSNLSEIKKFTIRKVKQEKDKIRVSYDVGRN